MMALPCSDAVFLKIYESECTETFWDGRVEAIELLGGVSRRIVYDNSRAAVSQIIGRPFLELAGYANNLAGRLRGK